jgi:hypothetical protein
MKPSLRSIASTARRIRGNEVGGAPGRRGRAGRGPRRRPGRAAEPDRADPGYPAEPLHRRQPAGGHPVGARRGRTSSGAAEDAQLQRGRRGRSLQGATHCTAGRLRSAARPYRGATPPLKRAVDRITLTLKQRIEANRTPLSLEAQQRLLGDSPRTTHTPRLLGVSGARLSTHLAQLQKLVGGLRAAACRSTRSLRTFTWTCSNRRV